MNGWNWLRIGAILGALAVGIGAFGAHGLRGRFEGQVTRGEYTRAEADRFLEVFDTGVRYHLAHALAVLAVGLIGVATHQQGTPITLAGWFFLAGILLFSGSLYLLAVTGTRWLGAITPLGGVALILGWAALAWACSGRTP